jgi:protein-L-isoaspartate(D-aspartate) O-methyltransferase
MTERNPALRQKLSEEFLTAGLNINIVDSEAKEVVNVLLEDSDIIVGSVYDPGARAPIIIGKDLLKEISKKKRKFIVDVAIDQGGNIFGSHTTYYGKPLFKDKFRNTRFCVANMPGAVPKQASETLEEAKMDYVLALTLGLDKAVEILPELASGINIRDGEIVLKAVADAHGLPFGKKPDLDTFGQLLRFLRQEAKLTQWQFAQKTELHPTHIHLLELDQALLNFEALESITQVLSKYLPESKKDSIEKLNKLGERLAKESERIRRMELGGIVQIKQDRIKQRLKQIKEAARDLKERGIVPDKLNIASKLSISARYLSQWAKKNKINLSKYGIAKGIKVAKKAERIVKRLEQIDEIVGEYLINKGRAPLETEIASGLGITLSALSHWAIRHNIDLSSHGADIRGKDLRKQSRASGDTDSQVIHQPDYKQGPGAACANSPDFRAIKGVDNLIIAKDYEGMSEAAAQEVKAAIDEAIGRKGKAVLLLPTGKTPSEMYNVLVRMARADEIDFTKVTIFMLDEYAGARDFHIYIYEQFINRLPVNNKPQAVHILDGTPTEQEEIDKYRQALKEAGEIDLAVLGIGTKGHLAFIEKVSLVATWRLKYLYGRAPPQFNWPYPLLKPFIKDFYIRKVRLAKSTIDDNKLKERKITHAYTIDILNILNARKKILLASDKDKAEIIKDALLGEISGSTTASLLRLGENFTVIVDREAAKYLKLDRKINGAIGKGQALKEADRIKLTSITDDNKKLVSKAIDAIEKRIENSIYTLRKLTADELVIADMIVNYLKMLLKENRIFSFPIVVRGHESYLLGFASKEGIALMDNAFAEEKIKEFLAELLFHEAWACLHPEGSYAEHRYRVHSPDSLQRKIFGSNRLKDILRESIEIRLIRRKVSRAIAGILIGSFRIKNLETILRSVDNLPKVVLLGIIDYCDELIKDSFLSATYIRTILDNTNVTTYPDVYLKGIQALGRRAEVEDSETIHWLRSIIRKEEPIPDEVRQEATRALHQIYDREKETPKTQAKGDEYGPMYCAIVPGLPQLIQWIGKMMRGLLAVKAQRQVAGPGSLDNDSISDESESPLQEEIQVYLNSIASNYHRLFRQSFPEYPRVCVESSRALSLMLSKKFGLPIEGDAPERVEIEEGECFELDSERRYHQWVVIYKDDKKWLFVDAMLGLYYPGILGRIICENYDDALGGYSLYNAQKVGLEVTTSFNLRQVEALERFVQEHNKIRATTLADGTVYAAMPFSSILALFKELERRFGDLRGKHLLDFGAGDLRISLVAAYLYGMKVTAVEKCAYISEQASKILEGAKKVGFAEGISFLGSTDALDVDWSDIDIVPFFYTEPAYPKEREPFRDKLQKKMQESRPGTILALAFLECQVAHKLHIFPELKTLEPHPIWISPELGGIYLQFYQALNEPSLQNSSSGQDNDSVSDAVGSEDQEALIRTRQAFEEYAETFRQLRGDELEPLHENLVIEVLRLAQERHKALGIPHEPIRLLDVGMGYGKFFAWWQKQPDVEIWGGDFSRTMLQLALQRDDIEPGRILQFEAKYLPFTQNSFDVVFAHAVYHHLEYSDDVLVAFQEAWRALRSGGLLYAFVRRGTFSGFRDEGAGEIYYRYYEPEELKQLLESSGFLVSDIMEVGDPYQRGLEFLAAFAVKPATSVEQATYQPMPAPNDYDYEAILKQLAENGIINPGYTTPHRRGWVPPFEAEKKWFYSEGDRKDKKLDWQRKRRKLIEKLRIAGITDGRVLEVMGRVPREKFVPAGIKAFAYENEPLPIGGGQTISQPEIVAFMTEALKLKGDEKVLEIGTGSGYQAAILAELAEEVCTIEKDRFLAEEARQVLEEELDYTNIRFQVGNGYEGWQEEARFDAIIVTAAPQYVPRALLNQLKPGGRLVIPVGGPSPQLPQWLLLIKKTETGLECENKRRVHFVSMTGEGEREVALWPALRKLSGVHFAPFRLDAQLDFEITKEGEAVIRIDKERTTQGLSGEDLWLALLDKYKEEVSSRAKLDLMSDFRRLHYVPTFEFQVIEREFDIRINRFIKLVKEQMDSLSDIEEKTKFELEIKDWLFDFLKTNLTYRSGLSDLDQAFKEKVANCFLASLIFEIIGKAIGLKVRMVDVVEDQNGVYRPHNCNLLKLSDGRRILVDIWQDAKEAQHRKIGLRVKDKDGWGSRIIDFQELESAEDVRGLSEDEVKAITYYNRGHALQEQGNYDEAIKNYDLAIKLWPDYARHYFKKAEIYNERGEVGLAVLNYRRATLNLARVLRITVDAESMPSSDANSESAIKDTIEYLSLLAAKEDKSIYEVMLTQTAKQWRALLMLNQSILEEILCAQKGNPETLDRVKQDIANRLIEEGAEIGLDEEGKYRLRTLAKGVKKVVEETPRVEEAVIVKEALVEETEGEIAEGDIESLAKSYIRKLTKDMGKIIRIKMDALIATHILRKMNFIKLARCYTLMEAYWEKKGPKRGIALKFIQALKRRIRKLTLEEIDGLLASKEVSSRVKEKLEERREELIQHVQTPTQGGTQRSESKKGIPLDRFRERGEGEKKTAEMYLEKVESMSRKLAKAKKIEKAEERRPEEAQALLLGAAEEVPVPIEEAPSEEITEESVGVQLQESATLEKAEETEPVKVSLPERQLIPQEPQDFELAKDTLIRELKDAIQQSDMERLRLLLEQIRLAKRLKQRLSYETLEWLKDMCVLEEEIKELVDEFIKREGLSAIKGLCSLISEGIDTVIGYWIEEIILLHLDNLEIEELLSLIGHPLIGASAKGRLDKKLLQYNKLEDIEKLYQLFICPNLRRREIIRNRIEKIVGEASDIELLVELFVRRDWSRAVNDIIHQKISALVATGVLGEIDFTKLAFCYASMTDYCEKRPLLRPEDSIAWDFIEEFERRVEGLTLDEQIEFVRQEAEAQGDEITLHFMFFEEYLSQGKLPEALRELEEILIREPNLNTIRALKYRLEGLRPI